MTDDKKHNEHERKLPDEKLEYVVGGLDNDISEQLKRYLQSEKPPIEMPILNPF
jgi:hypothetical protein